MSNKKPFKETGIGKVLGFVLKSGVKKIPVVGDLVENITSKDGGEGQVDYAKLVNQTIRLIVFLIMVYLFLKGSGEVTIDELQSY
jgi:hypothetical protein